MIVHHLAALADGATQQAGSVSGGGVVGGGAALAALLGFGWLFHHVHNTRKHPSTSGKQPDPRRWVVIAFLLGILLTTGTTGLAGQIHHGAASIGSIVG